MEDIDIFVAVGLALISIFGSCVRWLNTTDMETRKFFTLITEAASAGFSGLLVYCVYAWLNVNMYITFAIAGVVGHQGVKGLDMVLKYILKNSFLKDVKPDAQESAEESKGPPAQDE